MTRLVWAHFKAEVLGAIRVPGFVIPTMVFPSMFFLLFAVPYLKTWPAANQTTASFMAFAVFGVIFFQYAVGAAEERQNPWYAYLRTLPLPPLVRPLAQVLAGLLLALTAALVVAATAWATTPLRPGAASPLGLLAALALGAVPLGLLGLAVAYLFPPRAALPVANLLYLPLSYLGGLWMPPEALPAWAQKASLWTPTRHWAELLWASARGEAWPPASLAALSAYALIFAALAAWAWRRER